VAAVAAVDQPRVIGPSERVVVAVEYRDHSETAGRPSMLCAFFSRW
jgi:hypothetical protein